MRMGVRWALALLAAAALGCTAEGGGSASTSDDAGALASPEADAVAGAADSGANEPPAPIECAATPAGAISTKDADVIYQGRTVTASATHLAVEGCLTSLEATFAIDGGCKLSLAFEAVSGAWTLASGTFTGDALCGEFWPEASMGDFTLDATASAGGILTPPKATAADGCVAADAMGLVGRARFVSGEKAIDVRLGGLSLKGTLRSLAAAGGGACPAAVVTCEGLACGDDAWGADCGACGEGLQCEAGQCVEGACPPQGPFGTTKGKVLTDVELKDCDGNVVRLHDLCGADAGYFFLFAGW